MPVRADRAVHEALVAAAHVVGTEAEALREPGAQALQEHVAPFGEPEHSIASAFIAERDGQRPLAGVHCEEHRALAVPEWRPPRATVVAGVGPLDLDHVRAERGEDLGAVRPGDRRRDVERAHPVQWPERHRGIIAAPSVSDTGVC